LTGIKTAVLAAAPRRLGGMRGWAPKFDVHQMSAAPASPFCGLAATSTARVGGSVAINQGHREPW
jgi:hypothetical protein